MTAIVRLACTSDLPSLLALFGDSEVSAAAPSEDLPPIWRTILDQSALALFVADEDGRIVSTCTLITAPNLLREGRQHAFLENVVTHPDHRGRGHGRAVVEAALAHAWRTNCHHVLLQSGRADPRVHRFYENAGFRRDVRTAYVTERPGALSGERFPPNEG